MTALLPRPVRDVVTEPLYIKNFIHTAKQQEDGSVGSAIIGIFGGGFFIEPAAQKTILAASRVALASLGAFVAIKLGAAFGTAAAIGALVSLPSVTIIGGSYLAYNGAAGIIASLASGSFATLGYGLLTLAAGWVTLEIHDILQIGILESYALKPFAEKNALPFARLFQ